MGLQTNILRQVAVAVIFGAWSTLVMAQWHYKESTDKMSGRQIKSAMIESSNSLSLDFPYGGRNHGNLLVRQHPQYGLDVIFYVDKGQIPCTLGCTGQVRFDDGKPQRVRLDPPADHDSTTVFIQNPRAFIASAKKAKRILVQVTMYQAGSPILEFDTPESLKWDAPPAKKKK